MPVLNLESAAASLVSNVSMAGSGHVKDRQAEDSYDQQQREKELEGFEEKMPLCPPGAQSSMYPLGALAGAYLTFLDLTRQTPLSLMD